MRALSTAELLAVWEVGIGQSTLQRALSILATACTDGTLTDQLANLSIGQRDERLLTLREQTFGPQLTAVATCPACDEQMEFGLGAADVRTASPSEPVETIELEYADYRVQVRLPNSHDLATLDPNSDNGTNRQRLLERCTLEANCAGRNISADDLPSDVVDVISKRAAAADPQADVQLLLSCPSCRHQWDTAFDIVAFFWEEIQACVIRLLRDVHELASAYGWSELEILALSAWRREAYLEMVRA
jgi:hypothetical protein